MPELDPDPTLPSDPEEAGASAPPSTAWWWLALIAALAPFAVSLRRITWATRDGVVTDVTYRDWIAIVGGALALALATTAAWRAARALPRRTLAVVLALGIAGLGGLQVARGFGLAAEPPTVGAPAPAFRR